VGRYADVYQGVKVDTEEKVAIKILKPIRKEKVRREIKVMKVLSECPGIAHFIDQVKDASTKAISLVIFFDTYCRSWNMSNAKTRTSNTSSKD